MAYGEGNTPILLPGKSHGQRSLVGCSPWGWEESDTTEWLHFPFSLSCIGEGNGNPLQCSCLEDPRDGGAWWAAVYGVAQSWTRLKWLSSSSSNYGLTGSQHLNPSPAISYLHLSQDDMEPQLHFLSSLIFPINHYITYISSSLPQLNSYVETLTPNVCVRWLRLNEVMGMRPSRWD